MSRQLSDRRKTKELKVLELHDRGYSYRKIAKEVHLSLREVTKYIQTISNKRKSQSSTSINDEIVLEYRVNLLRSEVRDLKVERDNLKNKVNDLRVENVRVQNQLREKQLELGVMKRNLKYEKLSQEILNDIFTVGH
jgi:orotate phosphoribosyltransferase-like protein